MVKVVVRCAELEKDGWELADTDYEVLPRVGDEILVATQQVRKGGVSTGTSDFLIVERVTHFPATCNGHVIQDRPTIVLYTRKSDV